MIEQDYIDVKSESETGDEMDNTRSSSTRSRVDCEKAPPQPTTEQNNDIIISTMQMLTRPDTGLSKTFKEIIDLLEEMEDHYTPRSARGIVNLYDLAKDADNNSRGNLRLLAERLQSAQLMRNETITGLALNDDIRVLRDDLSKLTKTMTTDNNSVPPALKNDFKALREAVIESLWANDKDSQNLEQHISDLKGRCAEADNNETATLYLLADELDTFRYELAMLRRDITSVRVPGALTDVSISSDVDALTMGVSTLELKYGPHNGDAFTSTDISTLRDRVRILRGAASTIHYLLSRNENLHQLGPELQTNIGEKTKILSIQVQLGKIRDRIQCGPSPPLHHSLLEHDFAMAHKEELALRQEMASLRNEKYSEPDSHADWLLGPFDHDDSMKAKILDLCKNDPAFKDKLEACVSEETQSLPAAHQDAVDPAKDNGNLSSADIEASEPKQTAADSETSELEQSALKPYLLEFERKVMEPMRLASRGNQQPQT